MGSPVRPSNAAAVKAGYSARKRQCGGRGRGDGGDGQPYRADDEQARRGQLRARALWRRNLRSQQKQAIETKFLRIGRHRTTSCGPLRKRASHRDFGIRACGASIHAWTALPSATETNSSMLVGTKMADQPGHALAQLTRRCRAYLLMIWGTPALSGRAIRQLDLCRRLSRRWGCGGSTSSPSQATGCPGLD